MTRETSQGRLDEPRAGDDIRVHRSGEFDAATGYYVDDTIVFAGAA
jgi:hypothetical protein